MRALRAALAGLAALGALDACAVGPSYHRPQIATPPTYAEASTAARARAGATAGANDRALARWWDSFSDPTLSDLIDRAVANNPDLQTAASRVREARLQESVTRAAAYPNISAAGDVLSVHSGQGSSPSSGGGGASSGSGGGSSLTIPSALNLYSAGFDATWEVNLFGERRAVEAASANREAASWARRDGEVSLTAEIANDYLTLRALQTRITLGQAEIQRETELFALIRARRQAGFVTRLNVNQQVGAVESATAQIPELQAQAKAEIHSLGVLLGETPEALGDRLAKAEKIPPVPPPLPVGLPSELLRRRPDVREAERRLAASNAQIGVQVASLYPKINLIALGSFAGTSLDELFSRSNLLSAVIGMVSEPLFDAGRRRASVNIAREETLQAALAYRKIVLGALRDVEDALSRYRSEQVRQASLTRSIDATRNSLTIARDEYQTGFVTFVNVLDAQNAVLRLQDQLTQSDAQILTDLVALYKALGGGWSAS